MGTSHDILNDEIWEQKETIKKLKKEVKKYQSGFNILMEYWDSIHDSEKEDVDKRLKKLGL